MEIQKNQINKSFIVIAATFIVCMAAVEMSKATYTVKTQSLVFVTDMLSDGDETQGTNKIWGVSLKSFDTDPENYETLHEILYKQYGEVNLIDTFYGDNSIVEIYQDTKNDEVTVRRIEGILSEIKTESATKVAIGVDQLISDSSTYLIDATENEQDTHQELTRNLEYLGGASEESSNSSRSGGLADTFRVGIALTDEWVEAENQERCLREIIDTLESGIDESGYFESNVLYSASIDYLRNTDCSVEYTEILKSSPEESSSNIVYLVLKVNGSEYINIVVKINDERRVFDIDVY